MTSHLCLMIIAAAPDMAVTTLQAEKGMDEGVVRVLNETMLAQLAATGRFGQILSGSDIQAMLDHEQAKTMLGCEQDSCLAQLGGALGVPFLLVPSVGKVGSRIVLNLKIVGVDEAKVMARHHAFFTSQDQLLDGLSPGIEALIKGFDASSKPKRVETSTPRSESTTPTAIPPKGTPPKRPPWIGLSMVAAGIGLLVAGPSDQDLLDARADYDQAMTPASLSIASYELDNLANDAYLYRSSGGILLSAGLGLSLWRWWGPR